MYRKINLSKPSAKFFLVSIWASIGMMVLSCLSLFIYAIIWGNNPNGWIVGGILVFGAFFTWLMYWCYDEYLWRRPPFK